MKSTVPDLRVRVANRGAVRPDAAFVLYWMTAARRRRSNFALQRAVDHARHLGKPLVVFEALRCGYPWASDRLHRFVLDGMASNAAAFGNSAATYYPYVEPTPDAGKGLLAALAERACVVVGDDYPCFHGPAMTAAAAMQIACALEVVDGNGVLPMRVADKVFGRAFDFRRFMQKVVLSHLADAPRADPLARVTLPALASLPVALRKRWPQSDARTLAGDAGLLASLPIDHAVPVVTATPGGADAARARLATFVRKQLARYHDDRNHPDLDAASGLSPYLHFGHVGAHEVFTAVAKASGWKAPAVAPAAAGKVEGFWRMGAGADAFLDQLITWRELGFNFCHHRADHARYESLPAWVQATLAEGARDPRPVVYDLATLEAAATHDPLWNAAQTQLRRDGTIHNYLRMLWGKKILEWSATPQAALDAMIALNDRWALDGRDPNSYSGILWCLGRYDRPWAPRRPIFGMIRYMSSDSARRKLRLKAYLARYGADAE